MSRNHAIVRDTHLELKPSSPSWAVPPALPPCPLLPSPARRALLSGWSQVPTISKTLYSNTSFLPAFLNCSSHLTSHSPKSLLGPSPREWARTPGSPPRNGRLPSKRERQEPQHCRPEAVITVILGDSGSNLILFEAQNNPSGLPAYFLNVILHSNDGTCGGGNRRDFG